MFDFELEKGSRKFTCPNCGALKKFKRYVKKSTGEYLAFEFGRCDRESTCGYHLKPQSDVEQKSSPKRRKHNAATRYGFADKSCVEQNPDLKQPDYIEFKFLQKTLANYEQNAFVQFLFNLFPADIDQIWQAVKKYFIGTTRAGKTVFWQIDRHKRIRTGKILAYDVSSGKRKKDVFPTWAHAELKRTGLIKKDFNLRQCFFGEHLLQQYPEKPIAVAEAEKTAVIASLFFPEFIWLAAGAKQNLKAYKLILLGRRPIILYPDGDSFTQWAEEAQESRKYGLTANVSTLIETLATSEQKAAGYDLADYLIDERRRIVTEDFSSISKATERQ